MKLVLELGQREPQEMLGFRQKNFVPFPLEGGTDTKQQGCWAQRGGPLLDMWQTQIAEYIIHIHVEKGCASKDTSHDPELGIVVCKHSGHKYLKKKICICQHCVCHWRNAWECLTIPYRGLMVRLSGLGLENKQEHTQPLCFSHLLTVHLCAWLTSLGTGPWVALSWVYLGFWLFPKECYPVKSLQRVSLYVRGTKG